MMVLLAATPQSPGSSNQPVFGLNPWVWVLIIVAVGLIAGATIAFVVLRRVRSGVAERVALRQAMGMPGYGPPHPQYRAPRPDVPPGYRPPDRG